MAITSAEELARRAVDFELVDARKMQEVLGEFGSREVELDELRRVLLRRDLLTFYQIEHLIAENRSTFYYGDYKVLYLVGTGTFARVYRAEHRTNGDQVAIKVLRRRFCEVPEEVERFDREGMMAQTLQHPNIVPVYESFSRGNTHYQVIEFVEGQNLRQFMKVRKQFEPMQATKLMLDVANGLDYAFQRGISHRDLKMSNVLVSSRGQAKLVDFGLAGVETDGDAHADHEEANPRAIDYAGLERATGMPKGDERSDIFFVGCMYYHMLCGEPALSETRDRIQRLSTGRFRDIRPILSIQPDLPAQVAMAVAKAIQFDPERRYQTPGELASALQDVLDRYSSDVGAQASSGDALAAAREGVGPDGKSRTLMLVESNVKMQDTLRQRLKRNGYRVLVTGDPQRAQERFLDDPSTADLVIYSAADLGQQALEGYREFVSNKATQNLPALLLLDNAQSDWEAEIESAGRHAVLKMPIKLRELRETLVKLLTV